MAEPWALELLLGEAALPAAAQHVSGAFDDADEELLLPELPSWVPDGAARGLRCLESAHGADCSRCVHGVPGAVGACGSRARTQVHPAAQRG